MKSHIVKDGNAFYEIDEECMRRREREEKESRRSADQGQPQGRQKGDGGCTR